MPPQQLTKEEVRQIAIQAIQEFLNLYQFPFKTVRTPHFVARSAVPAAGNNSLGIKFSTTNNFGVFFGSGVPTLSAAQGSIYLRTDGSSTSTRMYINTTGSTTWTNVTTAA